MANTYTLINSTSLSTTAASVTFSSIPASHNDLLLKYSVRMDFATAFTNLEFTFNSVGGTSYSRTGIRGDGASATSSRASSAANITLNQGINGTTTTSNTFTNGELYLPAYTVSQNKPMSFDYASEDNATTAYIWGQAGLFSNTGAISSIAITANTTNFVSGSTFWLYGIKNS